jgi:hypothetical protein
VEYDGPDAIPPEARQRILDLSEQMQKGFAPVLVEILQNQKAKGQPPFESYLGLICFAAAELAVAAEVLVSKGVDESKLREITFVWLTSLYEAYYEVATERES